LFFSEEKAEARPAKEPAGTPNGKLRENKSFLLLFFKKEGLPSPQLWQPRLSQAMLHCMENTA
jgi:hypothetical protein